MADKQEHLSQDQRKRGRGKGRPFQKGRSGNPGGRPKGKTLTERLRDVLEGTTLELDGKTIVIPEGGTVADALCHRIVGEAVSGNWPYVKELLDRLEGKPPDRVRISGPGAGVLSTVTMVEVRKHAECGANGNGQEASS